MSTEPGISRLLPGWWLAFALLPCLACDGCRRASSTSGTRADASSETDAAREATAMGMAPWGGRVVARSVGVGMSLVRMNDDGLVVAAGPALFAVAPGGVLERIGTPADAVTLLPDGDEEMGGWDARPISLGRERISGSATRPLVRIADTAAFLWSGKGWTKTSAPARQRPRYDGEGFEAAETAGLPAGHDWSDRHTTPKLTVWLGSKQRSETVTTRVDETVIGPASDQPARLVAFPSEHDRPTTYRSCKFIDSADDRVYLNCVSSDGGNDFKHRNYLLEEDRWVQRRLPGPEDGNRAIDAEGAVWWVGGGNPPPTWLVRIGRDGKEERFDPPTAPPDMGAPGYRTESIDIASNDSEEIRQWIATTILERVPPVPLGWIYGIFPRRSGDVWVIGRDSSSLEKGMTLVRYARGGPGAAPMLIRSPADEQNAVHHARGIRTWVGHCISLFVPFPRARRDAAAEPAAFYEEHKAEIQAAVALSDRKGSETAVPMEVAIVDGHLDGRAVGGILFIRSDPDADEKRMEAAVRKLAEIATPDPASPPVITCSLPQLDRVVERLRVAKPRRY